MDSPADLAPDTHDATPSRPRDGRRAAFEANKLRKRLCRLAGEAIADFGMIADGETIVDDVECVDTSFPGFVELFRGLGADLVVEDA